MVCGGCGTVVDAAEPYPFRCPARGDGETTSCAGCSTRAALVLPRGSEAEPVRALAGDFYTPITSPRPHGMSDEDFVGLVRDLDNEVARVDGHGFVVTPFVDCPELSGRLRDGRPRSG